MAFLDFIDRIIGHPPGLRLDTTHLPDRGPKTCPNCFHLYREIERLKAEKEKEREVK